MKTPITIEYDNDGFCVVDAGGLNNTSNTFCEGEEMSYRIISCPLCGELYKDYFSNYDNHKFNGCPRCKKNLEDAYAEQERRHEENDGTKK